MSKSSTIIKSDRLGNPHAGDLLQREFIEPLALDRETLAIALGVGAGRISDVVDGRMPMDADLDLRLTRYFGLSEGFFTRIQNRHDLMEAKRALNGELDRIVPRAA